MSTHNIPFLIEKKKKKIPLIYPKSAAMVLKNDFKTAVVNESSVFEPLKFYWFK